MRLTYRTRRYGTSFRSAGPAVGAARERQLCGPRSRGPKVGPVMPPSVRLRCGVTAALRAGPVLPLTAACGGLGLVDAAPGGVGTAKRHREATRSSRRWPWRDIIGGAKEDVLTTFMRRFVAPRRAAMSPGSPAPVFAGRAGPAALPGTGTVVAAGGPVGGGAVTVPHGVVVRRDVSRRAPGWCCWKVGWGSSMMRPGASPSCACLLDGTSAGVTTGVWGMVGAVLMVGG